MGLANQSCVRGSLTSIFSTLPTRIRVYARSIDLGSRRAKPFMFSRFRQPSFFYCTISRISLDPRRAYHTCNTNVYAETVEQWGTRLSDRSLLYYRGDPRVYRFHFCNECSTEPAVLIIAFEKVYEYSGGIVAIKRVHPRMLCKI